MLHFVLGVSTLLNPIRVPSSSSCVRASVFGVRDGEDRRKCSLLLQGSAKKWSPGCVNAASKAWQKWYATAGTKFTQPGARLSVGTCKHLLITFSQAAEYLL